MDKEQIYNETKKIITEIAEIEEERIQKDARLTEDVDVDSLTRMAILAALELKFNIRFPMERLQQLDTLGQLTGLIKELSENKREA
jgi:acyl carrier protein